MSTIEAADAAEVLAVLDHRDSGLPVTRTAEVIARLAHGEIRPVRLTADLSLQQAARQVVRALNRPRTVTAVLSRAGVSQPLWKPVSQQSPKPVVLAPAGTRDISHQIRRVLLPLDGTARSAAAVAATAELLARGGAELVVLHVFNTETVPKFWDQDAHAGQAWEQEFLARYCALPGARLELRHGAAAEHVVKVAGTEQADLIALAWSQRLEPGHAPVVQHAVQDAQVPVILVPMPAA